MTPVLRIGARGSPLSRAQTEGFRVRLAAHLGTPIERIAFEAISTSGDAIQDRRLIESGGKGLFTKEIDEALMARRIDLAVHSLKDLPTELAPSVILACVPEREDPREDVLAQVKRLLGEAFETANVPAYLNTLIRTNTFEALNEARFAAFEDPDLAGMVVAYEYSAILDNNTTEICQALDDGIWSQDNPIWETHRPPNHYNCRSLLVPILVTDNWDGVESPPPTVEPQDGF